MKQFLPILLVVLCYACSDQTTKEIPYTIIKGKITNAPLPENRRNIERVWGTNFEEIEKRRKEIGLITSAIRNGLGVPDHHGLIDEEGNYSFLIKLKNPAELRIKYNRRFVPFYAAAGDEITIDIDYTKEGNPISINGDHAEFSQQMIDYNELFRDSFNVELNATLPYAIIREFREQRAKITDRIRKFTTSYLKEKAPTDPKVTDWIKHHSEYRIAMDYMKYAFKVYGFNRFSPDLRDEFPTSYFDYWEEFPVNNPDARISLNYQNYLQLYRKYLMANLRQTTVYQDCVNFPNCNEFEMELAQLSDNLNGEVKNWVLSQQVDYQLIRNNKKFLDKGFNLFLNKITDSLIINDLLARKDFLHKERVINFSKDVKLIQTSGTGSEVLQQITPTDPNRTTLLFFWNTQREITTPYESKKKRLEVWEKLDSLGFDLVMLAHHSAPIVWKEKIESLNLIGEQWHLTDNQFNFFEDFYQNNRTPHQTYDRVLDRENFMLLANNEGTLNTLESISIRERPYTYLSRLHWQMISILNNQKNKRIKVNQ